MHIMPTTPEEIAAYHAKLPILDLGEEFTGLPMAEETEETE